MAHEHEHEHHHHHHHHDHDSPAARTAAGAFVLSRSRAFAGPTDVDALTAQLKALFLALGARAGREGIIPGHIKGVAAVADAALGLSVTRPGAVDLTPTGNWNDLQTIEHYTVSINVMLLSDVGIREDDLFAGL